MAWQNFADRLTYVPQGAGPEGLTAAVKDTLLLRNGYIKTGWTKRDAVQVWDARKLRDFAGYARIIRRDVIGIESGALNHSVGLKAPDFGARCLGQRQQTQRDGGKPENPDGVFVKVGEFGRRKQVSEAAENRARDEIHRHPFQGPIVEKIKRSEEHQLRDQRDPKSQFHFGPLSVGLGRRRDRKMRFILIR